LGLGAVDSAQLAVEGSEGSMTTQAPPDQGTSPPPAPRRKRHRVLYSILAGIGVIVVIIIAASVSGGGGTSTPTSSAPSSPPAASASTGTQGAGTGTQVAGIGTPVRDGKFEFVVTSVTYAKSVGDQYVGKTAQGRFALLHLKVTNIGNQSQLLSDSAQYVYDSSGRKYSADTSAGIYANSSQNSVFLNEINPGNTVRGVIAFDMPQGVKAVRAELHDSPFSGGVSVGLR
jgi:Domain of unknown function (DUF4352)